MSVCWNEYVRQYWCVDLYSMKIPRFLWAIRALLPTTRLQEYVLLADGPSSSANPPVTLNGSKVVKLCDNKTTVQVPNDTPKTPPRAKRSPTP